MTIIKVKTVSAQETAVILWAELGEHRAWSDFLADCIRGKANINGRTLLPVARVRRRGALRPVYALSHIRKFVADVLSSLGGVSKGPSKTITLPIDTAKSWRIQKFGEDGTPTKDPCFCLRPTAAERRGFWL